MTSLKVLHIIPSLAPCRGGPSKAAIDMVSALRKAGTEAEIVTTDDNCADRLNVTKKELVEYQGVPVRFFMRLSPPTRPLREFAYSWSLQRWLKKHINDYDLIHVHAIFSFCTSYAMRLARNNNIPYVVHCMGQLEPWSLQQSQVRKKIYLKCFELENLMGAAAIQFTAQSEQALVEQHFAKQYLEEQGLPKLKGTVIPLGVDLPMLISNAETKMHKRWGLDRMTPTILYLSRLHPKKGLEILLEALSKLGEQPYQLLIAGDGETQYLQKLQQKAAEFGIAKRCKFVGHLHGQEKNIALQGADLFALTSHSENFGIAVLEAMSSGTSVLLSIGVALSHEVEKNELGFVCDLSQESIQESLTQALHDIESTHELGKGARRFVENHYQWSGIADQLNKLYSDCL